MFSHKKKKLTYDKENLYPIIHSSICTGEKVIGFMDKRTKKFTEIMLVNNIEDINKFKEMYDIDFEIKIEY